jgi:hypothetical protein
MAGLEDGPDLHGKGLPAGIALPEAWTVTLALKAASLPDHATVGANRPIRPKVGLYEGIGGGFVGELGGTENGLGHGLTPYERTLILVDGDVKYNIADTLLRVIGSCFELDLFF